MVHSQAGTHLPPREGSSLAASQASQAGRQAGRHSPSLRGRKQFISFPGRQLTSSSFPGRCSPSPWGRKQFSGNSGLSGRQSDRCSPSPWVRKQLSSLLGPPGFPGEQCCLPGRQHWFPGRQPHTYPPNRLSQGSSPEDPNPKWVIILSGKPLTPAQRSVLAKGPNFAVSPKQPPNLRVHNCHRGSLH